MVAAAAITAMVVATQAPSGGGGVWWVGVAAGVGGGVLSGGILSETIVFAYEIIEQRTNDTTPQNHGSQVMVMASTLLVARAVGVPVGAALTAVSGGFNGLGFSEAAAAVGLGICVTAGAVAARFAHVRSTGLGVIALLGLDPVFAIVWMALAGAGIVNVVVFIAGVAALAVVNATIQTRDAATLRVVSVSSAAT